MQRKCQLGPGDFSYEHLTLPCTARRPDVPLLKSPFARSFFSRACDVCILQPGLRKAGHEIVALQLGVASGSACGCAASACFSHSSRKTQCFDVTLSGLPGLQCLGWSATLSKFDSPRSRISPPARVVISAAGAAGVLVFVQTHGSIPAVMLGNCQVHPGTPEYARGTPKYAGVRPGYAQVPPNTPVYASNMSE